MNTRALFSFAVLAGGGAFVWAFSPSLVSHTELVADPDQTLPGQGECSAGTDDGGMGPAMVRLPEGFCIDTTEVTRAQYASWLEESPAASEHAACSGDDDYEPSCAWPPGSNSEQPVVCVDWCDAHAFCEAAGKRLCGSRADGGPYAFDAYADAEVSEWHAACTSGGVNEYTYGNELDTQRCRGGDAEDYMTWGLVDVGTLTECRSSVEGYADVFDLSGHAAEWDNACEGEDAESPCRIRGGSFQHQGVGLRCAMAAELRWPRDRRSSSVGFRCCAD
jgi:sulfatase modifying factor 1